MKKKKIFIVEDHAFFRSALEELISQAPDVELCGFAADGEEALERLPSLDADLVIVDLSLPLMSGFDFAMRVRRCCPNLALVMLSGYANRSVVERARALGFDGYVVKGEALHLKAALLEALSGRESFPTFT